jgi:acyl-CoA synthetase (AMP-forming)/AMP-acid ligase II
MNAETLQSSVRDTETSAKIFRARTVGDIPPTEHQVPFHNIGHLLAKQVELYGDNTWMVFYSDETGRHEFSYRRFHELVCRTANFLLDQGMQRGDRIATVAYNHADTVVQYFAAWMIGAVVVPINVGEDDKRIGYILQNSQTKLAFVREQFVERVSNILKQSKPSVAIAIVTSPFDSTHGAQQPSRSVPAGMERKAMINFAEEIHRQPTTLRTFTPPTLDDEALIVYTSGTTGMPKGVVLLQYNLLIDAKAIAEWHGMTPDQRMMCVLPIHHVNGTIVTLLTPLYYGGSVVLNQKFHSRTFFQRIADETVHVASVVPTLLQFLLHEDPALSSLDLSHFRHIICGAGPLTVELAMKFENRFLIPIIHGYGLSETTCYSCFLPLDLTPEEHRHWMSGYGFPSIGVPLPPNEMAIHDAHGTELPEETRGEIVIRGHNVMQCYFANPEANASTFAHSWFRSGDEGFYKMDDKGRMFFFITGRIKELIIRGGSNISPFEIDEVLMNIPGVKAGLAVGFENDWYGEEIGAYVQLKDDASLTELDIVTACRKVFSFQKCPKVVLFGNDIPVTSTGKYQRNKLKPLFEKWRSTQFTESKHA